MTVQAQANDQITPKLVMILNEEYEAFDQMFNVLEKERMALETQKIEQIIQLSQQKQLITETLENCAQRRSKLMNQLSSNLEDHKDGADILEKLWQKILEKAKMCKNSNLINGKIISISQSSIQRSMRLLKSQSKDQGMTYGSKGEALTHSNVLRAVKA